MQIDYDSMMSIYENLNSLTKDLNDSVNDAKSVVNKMDNRDHWDGNGYNRYKEKYNPFRTPLRRSVDWILPTICLPVCLFHRQSHE